MAEFFENKTLINRSDLFLNNTVTLREKYYVVLMSLVIFVVFFVYSLKFKGPAYLSDEIGYLSKAIFLSDNYSDNANSWHGGYSILLTPIFYILDDIEKIWVSIQALNALLFSISFLILYRILKINFPSFDNSTLTISAAVSMSYPSWIVMSSYAFTTPLIVFVYLSSLYYFLKIYESRTNILICGLISGFAFWVHPTGISISFSFFLCLIIIGFINRKWSVPVLYFLLAVGIVSIYEFYVHEYFNDGMSSSFYPSMDHYGKTNVTDVISDISLWVRFFVIFLGVLISSVISSFGLVFISFFGFVIPSITSIIRKIENESDISTVNIAPLLMVLVCFTVIAIQSVYSMATTSLRIEQHFYGRYLDPYILPLLAIGLAVIWKKKHTIYLFLFSIFVSFFYNFSYSGVELTTINLINMPAFWIRLPVEYFSDHISELDFKSVSIFFILFLFGSFISSVALILGKRLFIIIFIVSSVFCVRDAGKWHQLILDYHSNPYSIHEFYRDNFEEGTCVVYDQDANGKVRIERYNLVLFYLFNYELKKGNFQYWLENCNGTFITEEPEKYLNVSGVIPIIMNKHDNLTVFIRDADFGNINTKALSQDDYILYNKPNSVCFYKECIDLTAIQLSSFSQVGELSNEGLESSGRIGYLFYGPYASVSPGDYHVEIEFKGKELSDVLVDVVSDFGQQVYFEEKIYRSSDIGIYKFKFNVHKEVTDLEVRLKVSEKSQVIINNLRISKIE